MPVSKIHKDRWLPKINEYRQALNEAERARSLHHVAMSLNKLKQLNEELIEIGRCLREEMLRDIGKSMNMPKGMYFRTRRESPPTERELLNRERFAEEQRRKAAERRKQ